MKIKLNEEALRYTFGTTKDKEYEAVRDDYNYIIENDEWVKQSVVAEDAINEKFEKNEKVLHNWIECEFIRSIWEDEEWYENAVIKEDWLFYTVYLNNLEKVEEKETEIKAPAFKIWDRVVARNSVYPMFRIITDISIHNWEYRYNSTLSVGDEEYSYYTEDCLRRPTKEEEQKFYN